MIAAFSGFISPSKLVVYKSPSKLLETVLKRITLTWGAMFRGHQNGKRAGGKSEMGQSTTSPPKPNSANSTNTQKHDFKVCLRFKFWRANGRIPQKRFCRTNRSITPLETRQEFFNELLLRQQLPQEAPVSVAILYKPGTAFPYSRLF